jgi:AcrR family transcriptional regulator
MCTDLRTKILKTAGELFFKFGIRSVSIDDICAELHISKKTFYTVFKQKDELIVELLDAMRQKKEKDYHLVMAQDGNVMDMLMANFKRLRGNSMDKHLAFVYDLEKFYPELWYERQKMMRDLDRTQTMHMLQKGIDQGMYRKDLDVEATAILFTHLVEQVFKDLTMMSVSQRVDYALDMLVRMVCSEEGMAYYLKLRV